MEELRHYNDLKDIGKGAYKIIYKLKGCKNNENKQKVEGYYTNDRY
jgi:hypothetical protein